MTGPKIFRWPLVRGLGLIILASSLAGLWSCVPAPKPAPVPPPQVEAPPPPVEAPPEKKPEVEAPAKPEAMPPVAAPELELVKELVVPGVAGWTDTGLDVQKDDEFVIKATGGISLQKGNPTAFCGPDGYDLRTAQQPLPDKNIGALVGRVVQLVSITTDPETKKQVRNELIETFYIGSESQILIPIHGRLFLGINENVVGDNAGEFKAAIFRPKKVQS